MNWIFDDFLGKKLRKSTENLPVRPRMLTSDSKASVKNYRLTLEDSKQILSNHQKGLKQGQKRSKKQIKGANWGKEGTNQCRESLKLTKMAKKRENQRSPKFSLKSFIDTVKRTQSQDRIPKRSPEQSVKLKKVRKLKNDKNSFF